jgi:hypothetical protein
MYSRKKSNARGFLIIICFYLILLLARFQFPVVQNIISSTPSVAFGMGIPLSSGVARNLAVAETRRGSGALPSLMLQKRIANTMLTTPQGRTPKPSTRRRLSFFARLAAAWTVFMILCPLRPAMQVHAAKDRDSAGPGLTTEFSATLEDVLQALQEVLHDQIIHGTYMFDKQQTLNGASVADSTPLFEPWRGDGKAFYKIRTEVIAPRHFRDSADQGTIAVRYIVTSVSPERTRLRVDAVFVENARHGTHPSDGTVESSESKIIQEGVQAIQNTRQEAAENRRRAESIDLAKQTILRQREDETSRMAAAESSERDLEQRINTLRHQIEMRIKAPGASLKSAPFRSASDVSALSAYADVLIVIVTPRWYGVETPDGQRGWLSQDQLEPLP